MREVFEDLKLEVAKLLEWLGYKEKIEVRFWPLYNYYRSCKDRGQRISKLSLDRS